MTLSVAIGHRLASARTHDLQHQALVHDHALALLLHVRRDQMEQFGGRTLVAELQNPDFVKFTESFGLPAASS